MDRFGTDELSGWLRPGDPDRQVLLLHGGPGLSHDYLLPLVEHLPGWTVASFQQRGLSPSTTSGPFDIPTAVNDVLAVLDRLGWDRPIIAGHSWGGLLAWHVAVVLGERLGGVLTIDPMGAVGDMELPAFMAELRRRLGPESVQALAELEAVEAVRPLDVSEELAGLELLWPSYFADASNVPPFEAATMSIEANVSLLGDAVEHQQTLLERLPGLRVPVGSVVGAGSPIPASASIDAMALVPGSWVEVVPDAGHFVWYEQPRSVAAGLDRLLA
ncbi:MAG: alpha/beta fold hydrolase [Marmoricola sp.]